MKDFNRKPFDELLVVPYSNLDKVERKYLMDRNHFNGEDHQDVLYSYGRPFAIVGVTTDEPYTCEVCSTNTLEVFRCSTIKSTYWGHESCIVSKAKELFDQDIKTDAVYFIELFNLDDMYKMATFEGVNSLAKSRDFLFVAYLHGASMTKNVQDIKLTFRDGSTYFQVVEDESYYVRCSKVYSEGLTGNE